MNSITGTYNRILARHRVAALAIALSAGAIALPAIAAAAQPQTRECCSVVELRRYIVFPGKREDLISLFEKEFIETQEDVGITVVGQFRDLNDPYRFTWVRGFSGMDARKKALGDFYFGPVWKKYRDQANPTLYDNDDVLLLHPASPGSGFIIDTHDRPPVGAGARGGFVVANIYYFAKEVPAEFVAHFNGQLMPLFERSGARVLGRFVSEKSKNTFERLPVREDANVFVWFAGFANRQAYDDYLARLQQDTQWSGSLFGQLYKSLLRPPELLMLTPTSRSLAH